MTTLQRMAKQITSQRNLNKRDVTALVEQAASNGIISKAEQTQLASIRDNYGDRMTRGAREAIDRVLGNLASYGEPTSRDVDPGRVQELIDSDPRLAWRGAGARSESGGSESGGGTSTYHHHHAPTYSSGGGGE